MYLKKLYIKHFRCFNNYEVEFAPHVTILFGKNGSGKTTLIHAMRKALSFMMHSEKIKVKDPKSKKMKPVGEKTLRSGNPYVSVEGYSLVGDAHAQGTKRGDYLIEIGAEAFLDEYTFLNWCMSAYAINCRLRPSEYKEAFEKLYYWHQETEIYPLLAYYSDGYPHYSHNNKQKKEKTKESFLVKSNIASIGYTDWSSESGCTNTWVTRLETKIRATENLQRQIKSYLDNKDGVMDSSVGWSEIGYNNAKEELSEVTKEIEYITNALRKFSEHELAIAVDILDLSPYDAHLRIMTKDRHPYSFRNLPAGYKRLFSIALDLAYRSFFLGKDLNIVGVAIIDEIDQHLHPELEQVVLARLMATFPNLQFIVSTHSPLVLTGLKTVDGQNRILKMQSDQTSPTTLFDIYGLDMNSGLQEVMDVNPNDEELNRWISRCAYMISKGYIEQAENLKKSILEKGVLSPEIIDKRIGELLKKLG
ncbi:MAG: AAA family ATPase [Prevotella sp.]|nr:AAA family ATPase [Prevotella sp.]